MFLVEDSFDDITRPKKRLNAKLMTASRLSLHSNRLLSRGNAINSAFMTGGSLINALNGPQGKSKIIPTRFSSVLQDYRYNRSQSKRKMSTSMQNVEDILYEEGAFTRQGQDDFKLPAINQTN